MVFRGGNYLLGKWELIGKFYSKIKQNLKLKFKAKYLAGQAMGENSACPQQKPAILQMKCIVLAVMRQKLCLAFCKKNSAWVYVTLSLIVFSGCWVKSIIIK